MEAEQGVETGVAMVGARLRLQGTQLVNKLGGDGTFRDVDRSFRSIDDGIEDTTLQVGSAKLRDVNVREVIVVAPLIALSLFLGLYPKPALDRIQPSVKRAVTDLERKSDYREPHPPGIAKVLTSGSSGDSESGKGSK